MSTNAVGHLRHIPYSEENPVPVGCATMNAVERVEIEHKRAVNDCVMPNEAGNIGDVGGLQTCSEDIFSSLGQSCSVDGAQSVPEPT